MYLSGMTRILPRTAVPALEIDTLNGGRWSLADQSPEHFTFVFFYRGLHCPLCAGQLQDVERNLNAFHELGIEPIARTWDLYMSNGFKEGEPGRFSEPALYIVRPDGTLYATAMQSMPFTRPGAKELIQGFKYIIPNNYPSRGEA